MHVNRRLDDFGNLWLSFLGLGSQPLQDLGSMLGEARAALTRSVPYISSPGAMI